MPAFSTVSIKGISPPIRPPDRLTKTRSKSDILPSVGSYGTRNIVVIGMMVLERPTECILLMICLSSILRGIPLSGEGFA
jgi:hypothetical protein